jgi:hypothetical protein
MKRSWLSTGTRFGGTLILRWRIVAVARTPGKDLHMIAIITVYASDEAALEPLAEALRAGGTDLTVSTVASTGALYLDQALVDADLWRLMAAMAGGAASAGGKALLDWALTRIRTRRDGDPPAVITIGRQKIVLTSEQDRRHLRDALDAVDAPTAAGTAGGSAD